MEFKKQKIDLQREFRNLFTLLSIDGITGTTVRRLGCVHGARGRSEFSVSFCFRGTRIIVIYNYNNSNGVRGMALF